MSFIKKHLLTFIFLAGLIIRLLFIFGNYSFDVNSYIVWAKDLHERGFLGFFNKQSSEVYGVLYPNYPPLTLFIFYLFYPLPKIIFNFFWFLNTHLPVFPSNFISLLESIDKRLFLAAMLKLPAILSDIGLAWIMTLFTKKIYPKRNLSLLAVSLILFNPVFIYNSSLWGQIDSIPLFFVMVSIYFLLFSRKNILSGVFFILGLLVKPTVLVFLPVYGLIFLKKFGFYKTTRAILVSILVFWLLFLPFLKKISLSESLLIYWRDIVSGQRMPNVTNHAFNFWMLFTSLKKTTLDTASFISGLSYRFWGNVLTGIFLIIILFRLLRRKISIEITLYGLFFSSLTMVLFMTKMHERFFLLHLPFLLLLSIKNKSYLKYFCLMSIVVFLNLYHSWTAPYIPFIFKFIDTPLVIKTLSLMNVLIFIRFAKIIPCKS